MLGWPPGGCSPGGAPSCGSLYHPWQLVELKGRMDFPRTRAGERREWGIAVEEMGQGRQGCLYVVDENETRYQEVTLSV